MAGVQIEANGNITEVNYIEINEQSAPANSSNGSGRVYTKTGSGGLFWKPNSAGVEVSLAGSSTVFSDTASVSSNTVTIPTSLNGNYLTHIETNGTSCSLINIDGDANIQSNGECGGKISSLTAYVVCAGQTANFTGTGITQATFYTIL